MLLKIAGKDYTTKIIRDTYDVNSEDVFTAWTDANYVKHRQIYRSKISGQFELYFKTEEEYEEFLDDVSSVKTQAGYCNMGVMVNNTNVFNPIVPLYVTFEPKRMQKVIGKGYFPSVQVKIEER